MKTTPLLFLSCLLILNGCSNSDHVEYELEDVVLYGYKEASIGGITFTMLKSDTFNVDRSGLFLGTKFWGLATAHGDSIILDYFDDTINFDSAPLPQFMVIRLDQLQTKLRDRKYYFNIGKNTLSTTTPKSK